MRLLLGATSWGFQLRGNLSYPNIFVPVLNASIRICFTPFSYVIYNLCSSCENVADFWRQHYIQIALSKSKQLLFPSLFACLFVPYLTSTSFNIGSPFGFGFGSILWLQHINSFFLFVCFFFTINKAPIKRLSGG